MRERFFLLLIRTRDILMPLFLVFCLVGCQKQQTLNTALEATLVAANNAYAIAVVTCDEKERAVIARHGSTREQDENDLRKIRQTCDALFLAFETAGKAAYEARSVLGESP